jgi:hypothetical protein
MNAVATAYEIRLAGHLDDHWANWLGELTITRNDDGTTTLMAHITDQAQLHGLLARLRDIGATLISLQVSGASSQGRVSDVRRGPSGFGIGSGLRGPVGSGRSAP